MQSHQHQTTFAHILDTKWGKNLGSLDSFSLIHIFSCPFSQGGLPSRGTLCWQTNKQAFSPSGGKDDLQLKYDNNSHCLSQSQLFQHQGGNHVDYNNCDHNPLMESNLLNRRNCWQPALTWDSLPGGKSLFGGNQNQHRHHNKHHDHHQNHHHYIWYHHRQVCISWRETPLCAIFWKNQLAAWAGQYIAITIAITSLNRP